MVTRIVLAALAATGCKGMLVGSFTGKLESSGATGAWVLDHGPCYSGERRGFYGATVESPDQDGVIVKFVKDPIKSWTVIANMADTCKPGATSECRAAIFTRDDCKTFAIDLQVDTTRKTQMFSGTVALDCATDDAHVAGKLELSACRTPP